LIFTYITFVIEKER